MNQEKISRKKLLQEPDEFLSLSERAWNWAQENRRTAVVAAAAAVAAVVLAIVAVGVVQRGRAQRATELAAAVESYLAGGDATAATTLAGLADRLGSSPGGAVARYFAAGARAGSGEREQAAADFAAAATAAGAASDLAPLARVAEGYLALAGDDTAAAEKTFTSLLAGDAVVPRALLNLELAGLAARAGRLEEARRLLRDVAAAHPDGPLGAKARERLALLGGAEKASS